MIRTSRKSLNSSSGSKLCHICHKTRKGENIICCDVCQNFFHFSCTNMDEAKWSTLISNPSLKWACTSCESSIVFSVDKKPECNFSKEELLIMFKEANDDFMSKMSVNFDNLRRKIDDNEKDSITRIENLNDNVNAEINLLKEEITAIKTKADETENKNLDEIVPQIESKLMINDTVLKAVNALIGPVESELDKMSRINNLNNLIIDNIPESPQENLYDIIYNICDEINMNIGKYDLNNIFRINSKKKVKSIMVCFQQKAARDFFFEAYLNKTVYLSNIGFTGFKGRIFVNEHLTAKNSAINKKLRLIKSKDFIKKCYTRNGICYLVHKESDKPYKIFNDDALQHFLDTNSILCDFDDNNNNTEAVPQKSLITFKGRGG